MKLIADSGASKTSWGLVNEYGEVQTFTSVGLNPYHITDDAIYSVLVKTFPNVVNPSSVKEVFFYGAGCKLEPMQQRMARVLGEFFSQSDVAIFPDIFGAARALFSNANGIVAILGTGLNTGFYNGAHVESLVPSLGYILGDEGSGCHMGKELLRAWQYGELPKDLEFEFEKYSQGLDLAELLEKVYGANAQRFLAGFMPFLTQNIANPYVQSLVDQSLSVFVEKHLKRYPQFFTHEIGVVGSVGYFLATRLQLLIEQHGGKLGPIVQHPIHELIKYHTISK